MVYAIANRTEDGILHIDVRSAIAYARGRPTTLKAVVDQTPADSQQQAHPQPWRCSVQERSLEGRHRLDRPISGVLTGASRDRLVRIPLLSQETQHRIHRGQTDPTAA